MKITFIAEHGIQIDESFTSDLIDIDENDFERLVRERHDSIWNEDDGSRDGYESIIDENYRKIDKFVQNRNGKNWISYLNVPYGYLIMSR